MAVPFSSVPENVAAFRRIVTPQIETAMVDGDSFPALVLNKSGAQTKLYDEIRRRRVADGSEEQRDVSERQHLAA